MRIRIVAIAGAAVLGAASTPAMGVTGTPLPSRDAVVISWEPGSRSNVLLARNGRVYVVHSLRRYRSGSRVRIWGVKWGRLGLGIKWGANPRGIKWGIRLAANGTFSSSLTRLGATRSTMALRGIVVRRWSRRVAVSFRGSIVLLPVARGAVWLPGGTLTKAGSVGTTGSRNAFTLRFAADGTPVVTGVTQVAPPVPNASLPFAGRITSIDRVNGTIVVDATKNPAYPLVLTLTFPESMDLAAFAVGGHVAGTYALSLTGPDLFVTSISRNNSFAQADDPKTNFVAPPPNPQHLQAIKLLRADWDAAKAAGKFTQQGNGLYESQRQQLGLIERALMRNQNKRLVMLKIDAFITAVQNARPNPLPPGGSGQPQIDAVYQQAVLEKARALRTLVGG